MKDIRLTDTQINDIAYEIGKSAFKFLNKIMERTIKKCFPDYEKINPNDFVNLVIMILINLSANKLNQTRKYYESKTKSEMDFAKLLSTYTLHLATCMTDEEKERYKNSLN